MTPNVTATLWVFLKPTVSKTKLEVAVISIVTAAFQEGNLGMLTCFPPMFKEKYSSHMPSLPRDKGTDGMHINTYACTYRVPFLQK